MSRRAEVMTGGPAWVDSRWFQRLLEIFPGTMMWLTFILPVLCSLVWPVAVAYYIIAFDLYWMVKSFRLSFNLIRAYKRLHWARGIDWDARLDQLDDLNTSIAQAVEAKNDFAKAHPGIQRWWTRYGSAERKAYQYLLAEERRLRSLVPYRLEMIAPGDVYHAVIMATYNESLDILEPSVKALLGVDYPLDRIIFVLAYEERGGERTAENARIIMERYGDKFAFAMAVQHPSGIAGEVIGKGGNISYAGRKLTEAILQWGINPEHVVVTTLDSDNRVSAPYFNYVTYEFAIDPRRKYKAYQPVPMFYNNIWDAPAAMRVIATGNSFWVLMEMMRPHRLRNFAAHSQPLAALIDTDYWSVKTIVEDGHQYWRSWFRYDGNYDVVPIFTPIYQDAVLADTYFKTFRAQFLQLRRWAWGASDFAYVMRHAIANPRISLGTKIAQLFRLFEGHYSWATAPLILLFTAWLPLYLNRQFSYMALAHNLPIITSRILAMASITLVLTIILSVIMLPPKPPRYHQVRFVTMLAQWVLLPLVSIVFNAFAAINAQTRLMFGKYLEFYVTEKATKK
ncbi:MAG TPA: hypothetical protein VI322_05550 [Candidatus Saccharimonadia bacterium]